MSFIQMSTVVTTMRKLASDHRGVTALEYGLIAASTAVVITAALATIGPKMTTIFTAISTAL